MNSNLGPFKALFDGIAYLTSGSLDQTDAHSQVTTYIFTQGGGNVTIRVPDMPTITMTEAGVGIGKESKDWTKIEGTKELFTHLDQQHVMVKQEGEEDIRIEWTPCVTAAKEDTAPTGNTAHDDASMCIDQEWSRDTY